MNHHEIEQQDIIERYLRHQLKPDERRAFQEHYFACDECFAAVESTAKFIAGVQRSARVGALAENAREVASAAVVPWWASFFKPAFALGALACLLLAVALGWLALRQAPQPHDDTARQQPAAHPSAGVTQQPSPTTGTRTSSPSATEKGTEKSEREHLDDKLAQNHPPEKGVIISVMLDATRDGKGGAQAKLPENAAALKLQVEVAVGAYQSYELQLFNASGQMVKTLSGLKANAQGTLTATIAAPQLGAGKYRAKLFGLKNQQKDFVGEYDLTLRR